MNSTNQPVQATSSQQKLINVVANAMPKLCDKCGNKYIQADLEVVSNDGARAVCKLNCTNCKNAYLLQVASSRAGMFSMNRGPVQNDITPAELEKFSQFEAIDTEEILDAYMQLEEIDSIEDFEKLFSD